MLYHYDKKNNFFSLFNEKNGNYIRSGILVNGKESNEDPFMSEFPELIDVGIMGHCLHGKSGKCLQAGIECYQSGLLQYEDNMSLEDFTKIVKQCKGRTYQFALGGRGDPDQHENFEEILKLCHENRIVPNFTSSGFGFNKRIVELCKKYCGAVAISWYRSSYTLKAIEMLINANVKTNIHYVLNNQTIDEAIQRLRKQQFPKGINAIIFLLHKPVGMGTNENILKYDDKRVREFFSCIDKNSYDFKIGFDSCTIPGLLNMTSTIDLNSLDTCEGGRWSAYITPNMKLLPCSFDNQNENWAVSLNDYSIEEAWHSQRFENFRNCFKNACPHCDKKSYCMAGCPITPEIVLCPDRL